jgi:hypothetical protein
MLHSETEKKKPFPLSRDSRTRCAHTQKTFGKKMENSSLLVLECSPRIFDAFGSTLYSRPVYPRLAQTVLAYLHRSQSISLASFASGLYSHNPFRFPPSLFFSYTKDNTRRDNRHELDGSPIMHAGKISSILPTQQTRLP